MYFCGRCLNMSSGPEAQAAFIARNRSTAEQDAAHSGLFYISQEVSKLVSSDHSRPQGSNSPSTRANETSKQAPFRAKREEEDAGSSRACKCCRHTLPHTSPQNQEKNDKEESHSNNVAALESKPECETHWKALNLINLQCQRLLHRTDESDPSSVSTTKCGRSTAKSSTSAAGEVGGDGVSLKHTPEPPRLKRDKQEMPACISVMKNTRGQWRWAEGDGSSGGRLHCCVDSSVHRQSSEKTQTVRLEFVDQNAANAVRDKKMVGSSVIKGLECEGECVHTTQEALTVPRSENVSAAPVNTFGSPNHRVTFNSDRGAAISKAGLMLDLNSNLALMAEPQSDTQLPPGSSFPPSSHPESPAFTTNEASHPLRTEDDKITTSTTECRRAAPQLSSVNCNGETPTPVPEYRRVQKEGGVPPKPQQCSWRTKTPRKQAHPRRSADVQDPNFQGVTFRMDTELDDSREQCRLLVTCKYSKELHKSVKKPRVRTRTSQNSLKISSSDEEVDPATSVPKAKVCASCCTRKTPMWRDAEDGTPLCNACGIRYKKYRVRCVNCWHIPRKEGNSKSCCLKCGKFVRPTTAQRKHTT